MWSKSYDINWQKLISKMGPGKIDAQTQIRLSCQTLGGEGWMLTTRWLQSLVIFFCSEDEIVRLAQPFCPIGSLRSLPPSVYDPLVQLSFAPLFQFFDGKLELLHVQWMQLAKQVDPCFWLPVAHAENCYCPVRCLSAPWALLETHCDQKSLKPLHDDEKKDCTLHIALGYTQLHSASLARLESGGALRLAHTSKLAKPFDHDGIPKTFWLSMHEPFAKIIWNQDPESFEVTHCTKLEETMYLPFATGDQMLWTITAQVGRLTLPVDVLAQIKPGYVIQTPVAFFDQVQLVTRSHLLGQGQLLRVQDHWWVELSDLWLPPGLMDSTKALEKQQPHPVSEAVVLPIPS